VRDGLKGQTGAYFVPDYRGIPVLSVFAPVDFGGQKWVLLAEIDEAEVLRRDRLWIAIAAAMIAGLAAAGLGLLAHKFTSGRDPGPELRIAS
jgi:methyl-accepting chemotaxis protein